MNKKEKTLPFGLLFEEAAPFPHGPISPVYDEEADLSYAEDVDGTRVPYVEFRGVLGTETITAVNDEETDEDEERLNQLMGTETATKADGEDTDEDPDDDDTYTKSMNDASHIHWSD
jgi:acetamidase/formamidase